MVYPNPKQKTIYNQPQWLQYLTTFDLHLLQIHTYCYKANGSAESRIKLFFRPTQKKVFKHKMQILLWPTHSFMNLVFVWLLVWEQIIKFT